MFSPVLAPLLDAGGPFLLVFLGIALLVVVIASIFIIIIEAAMLWKWFNYGSFGSSVVASLVMNITSTIAGVILTMVARDATPHVVLLFLISWLITIAIEAGVLMLMRRQAAWAQVLRMSLTVNTASYLLLITIGLLFGGLTTIR